MRLATLLSAMLLALTPLASAQTVTGSVTGTVVDAGGAIIAGAQVQLINSITRQPREFSISSSGAFEFSSILPGNYSLKVTHAGFKTYEQQNVTNQFAGARRSAHHQTDGGRRVHFNRGSGRGGTRCNQQFRSRSERESGADRRYANSRA